MAAKKAKKTGKRAAAKKEAPATKRFNVEMPVALVNKYKRAAARAGLSMSEWARQTLTKAAR